MVFSVSQAESHCQSKKNHNIFNIFHNINHDSKLDQVWYKQWWFTGHQQVWCQIKRNCKISPVVSINLTCKFWDLIPEHDSLTHQWNKLFREHFHVNHSPLVQKASNCIGCLKVFYTTKRETKRVSVKWQCQGKIPQWEETLSRSRLICFDWWGIKGNRELLSDSDGDWVAILIYSLFFLVAYAKQIKGLLNKTGGTVDER